MSSLPAWRWPMGTSRTSTRRTSTMRMADLVNMYKSLRWETTDASDVAIADVTDSRTARGLTDVAALDRRHPRWSGRARGCADHSALESVNDSALGSCVTRQTEHRYWFEQFQIAEYASSAGTVAVQVTKMPIPSSGWLMIRLWTAGATPVTDLRLIAH